ncbi:hypothetical protein HOH15_02465 [Candidatus Woesearchaeota archaeon]|nr:hypothetical protein [Candidatus Woesearchaeota archaeon]MBT6336845.1 hypothetical protein [Candidatus Woesearchaeota archaeon]
MGIEDKVVTRHGRVRSFVRNTGLALALAGTVLSSSGCGMFPQKEKLYVKQGIDRIPRWLSREDGEAELMRLASEELNEEGWIFLEILTQSKGKVGMWLDNSNFAGSNSAKLNLSYSYSFLDGMKEEGEKLNWKDMVVSTYHIHTYKAMSPSLKTLPMTKFRRKAGDAKYLEAISIPSPADWMYYINFDEEAKSIGVEVGYHKVATPWGVFKCAPMDKVKKIYKRLGGGIRGELYVRRTWGKARGMIDQCGLECGLREFHKQGFHIYYKPNSRSKYR